MTDSDLKIARTLRCPLCGELPATMFTSTLLACATDGCDARAFNFTMTHTPESFRAAAYLADENTAGIITAGDTIGPAVATKTNTSGMFDSSMLADSMDRYDTAGREWNVREHLHDAGYTCADGCAHCDPTITASPARLGEIRSWARTMTLLSALMCGPGGAVKVRKMMESGMAAVAGLYGKDAGFTALQEVELVLADMNPPGPDEPDTGAGVAS